MGPSGMCAFGEYSPSPRRIIKMHLHAPFLIHSAFNFLYQIASRSHLPLVQAEHTQMIVSLAVVSSDHHSPGVVQSDGLFHTLSRFEIENSTQNELGGKMHVSAFVWFFSEMGCVPRTAWSPSWFNEVIRYIRLGLSQELLGIFFMKIAVIVD